MAPVADGAEAREKKSRKAGGASDGRRANVAARARLAATDAANRAEDSFMGDIETPTREADRAVNREAERE